MVPAAEKDRLEMVLTAPSGRIPGPTPYSIRGITMNDLAGMEASSAADGLTSAYATFKTLPTRVVFGTPGELYEETT
jgi:hypothetical protein